MCLLLVLGAIVNIAVAWGPWLVRDAREWPKTWDSVQEPTNAEDAEHWKQRALQPFDSPAPHLCDTWHHWYAQERRLAIKSGRAMGTYHATRIRAGFPTRSMTLTTWHMSSMFLRASPSIGNDGIEVRSCVLPARIWWSGFAINTLFYAGILWVVFAAPFALRRRRRIKRGLCPACAYPVGASEVCTECGKSLPSPSRLTRANRTTVIDARARG
jgi:hypothetical protein